MCVSTLPLRCVLSSFMATSQFEWHIFLLTKWGVTCKAIYLILLQLINTFTCDPSGPPGATLQSDIKRTQGELSSTKCSIIYDSASLDNVDKVSNIRAISLQCDTSQILDSLPHTVVDRELLTELCMPSVIILFMPSEFYNPQIIYFWYNTILSYAF